MTSSSVFYQACPVCGRSIRMPVQYFGRQITCVHCGGEFRADVHSAGDTTRCSASTSMPGLLPAGVHALASLPAADAH